MVVDSTEDRTIRVFVSSTFRDMAAERNVLVGRVFPLLRDICARRAVAFSEIDLRWGLTDEEVAEGKVLPICLDEIRRCKPYFIGLLGERYGWIPPDIPTGLLKTEDWLIPHAGSTSVTELEILHGVLNDPEMAGNAYFYFRDPDYIGSERFLADTAEHPEYRHMFREHPSADEIEMLGPEQAEREARRRQRKLAALKERLASSHFPTRNFADPDALGDLVLADLKALIDEMFPEEASVDPLAAESRLHDFFAASRSKVYVRRPSYFETLDDFADEDDGGALTVLGDSGSGKSALLATWALGYRSRHPHDLVLMHFIGSSQKSTQLLPMLRRLNRELGLYLGSHEENTIVAAAHPDLGDGDSGPEIIDSDDSDEIRLFKDRLRAAGQRGKVIVVLDALNQLAPDDDAHSLHWLNPNVPSGVRIVVSALRGSTYDALKERGWLERKLKVRPLERSEREDLIDLYLGRELAKHLSSSQKQEIVNLPQADSPLYIRILLDELRIWGEHETLSSRIRKLTSAASIAELLQLILARYESELEHRRPDLVGDALRMIWGSHQGLHESELLELLGDGEDKLPPALWAPLHIAASEMLIERGGLLNFAHVFFESAVERRYLSDEPAKMGIRRALVAHFSAVDEPTPRALEELPSQVVELHAWQELAELLVDPRWFSLLWQRDRFEPERLWAKIQANSDIRAAAAYSELQQDRLAGADPSFLLGAATMLRDLGALDAALRLLEQLQVTARDDARLLQACLGDQALVYQAHGQLDRALELLGEQERMCRELSEPEGLQRSLGYQALIHETRGELDRALELFGEQQRICRELDRPAELQRSLGYQALVHRDRGELDRALELLTEQERICREIDRPSGLQRSLGYQAMIHETRGDLDRALELFGEQQRICRELDRPSGLQRSLGYQAMIHRDRGELDRALELLLEQEQICREIDRPSGLQHALCYQGLIHRDRGELDQALELLTEQERICRQLRRPTGLQRSLGYQALVHLDRGELDRAMDLFGEQERICRGLDHPSGLQRALWGQAMVHGMRGELDRALELLTEQERICRELDRPMGLSRSLEGQARIRLARGELENAEELVREAARVCSELGDPADLQRALGDQAAIHRARGDFDRAEELAREREGICRKHGYPTGLQEALGNQTEILRARGDLDRAAELAREQEQICRKYGYPTGLQEALGNQAEILRARGDLNRAAELAREQERICRELGYPAGVAESLSTQGLLLRDKGESHRAHAKLEDALQNARVSNQVSVIEDIEALVS